MAKTQKIDKEYILTDDSVNVYGFRLLTSGYQLDRYRNNPIGYRMHKREDGVVLKWEDFRQEGDKLYAKPVINLANPLGQQTADEVENGFLNAASVGGIVVLEFSDAPELMLPGQTGPTVTKWYNKETSLVDVPGNPNATVQLFDDQDNEINLADFIHQTLKNLPVETWPGFNSDLKQDNMSLKAKLLPVLLAAGIVNLSDASDDSDFLKHIQDLADKAGKVPGLESDLLKTKTAKETAESDLADFKATANSKAIADVTAAGLKDGRLTVEIATELSDQYKDNPEGYQKLVAKMPVYQTVNQRLDQGDGVKDLADMAWDELDKSGKLPDLKAKDLECFKEKFKSRFGTDYKG